MKRETKTRLKSLGRKLFERCQRLGIDILPHHFYSQIPDIAELRSDLHWKPARSMIGVRGALIEDQVKFLQDTISPELARSIAGLDVHRTALLETGVDEGYGVIESDLLYCFVLTAKPARIVQVGCGVSTAVILRAAHDAGYSPEIVCIEPFPLQFLIDAHAAGKIALVKDKAQKVDLQTLTGLQDNDLLFIDSTHTVKTGSEVNRIVLEVLPRLAKGVFVHFHDIYFPYDYAPGLLDDDLFFWSESTLLHAFLADNARYRIRASMSMVHYSAPHDLKELIPTYRPREADEGLRGAGGDHFPSSIYLQVEH